MSPFWPRYSKRSRMRSFISFFASGEALLCICWNRIGQRAISAAKLPFEKSRLIPLIHKPQSEDLLSPSNPTSLMTTATRWMRRFSYWTPKEACSIVSITVSISVRTSAVSVSPFDARSIYTWSLFDSASSFVSDCFCCATYSAPFPWICGLSATIFSLIASASASLASIFWICKYPLASSSSSAALEYK